MKTLLRFASLAGLLTIVACATHKSEPQGGYYGQQEYNYGKHYYSHPDHYYWRDGYFDDTGQYHYYRW